MNNYKNMSNEEIKEQLEWSDQYEFSYGYSIWAFNEIEQLKKQKDDVVEYIKSINIVGMRSGKTLFAKILNDLLRMLGEKDE